MDQYLSKLKQFVSKEERTQARFDHDERFKAMFRQNIELAGAKIVSPVVTTWVKINQDWIDRYHDSLGRYAQNVSQFPRTFPRDGDWLVTVQAYTVEEEQS